mmetsp:Transcript_35693/g.90822  ORF Transcript_35693/g.90822 Transcript_35693/m.90822 type:complete len:252 (+) Transcript_35693:887-1642(+)
MPWRPTRRSVSTPANEPTRPGSQRSRSVSARPGTKSTTSAPTSPGMAVPLARPPPLTVLLMLRKASLEITSTKPSSSTSSLAMSKSSQSLALSCKYLWFSCSKRDRRGDGGASLAKETQPFCTAKKGWRCRNSSNFSPQPSMLRAWVALTPCRQQYKLSSSTRDDWPVARKMTINCVIRAISVQRTTKLRQLASTTPQSARVFSSCKALPWKESSRSGNGTSVAAATRSFTMRTVSAELTHKSRASPDRVA